MKELILATSNQGKISEFQSILSPIQLISQNSLGIGSVQETGLSFIENALIKARHASRLSNKPALADDSGLIVPSLNGRPGVYSARFAGEHASDSDNRELLLSLLEMAPEAQRKAFFYCVLALVRHAEDPMPLIATGQWNGLIHHEAVGNGGFGYDSIFYVQSHECTAAQLPATIKNTISHRAQALFHLRILLNE